MNTKSDNPIAANRNAEIRVLHGALGKVPRSGVRTADMVKAGNAATAREFGETIHAGRPIARRGNDLSMEEI